MGPFQDVFLSDMLGYVGYKVLSVGPRAFFFPKCLLASRKRTHTWG